MIQRWANIKGSLQVIIRETVPEAVDSDLSLDGAEFSGTSNTRDNRDCELRKSHIIAKIVSRAMIRLNAKHAVDSDWFKVPLF
jgi:hypothetical protein